VALSLGSLLQGISLGAGGLHLEPESVAAAVQCVNDHHRSVTPGGFTSGGSEGARSSIAWTNPTVCPLPNNQGFVAESITVCRTGGCAGWMQAGWIKRSSYSAPKMYCEFAPDGPGRFIVEYNIPHATHQFKVEAVGEPFPLTWTCALNGADMHVASVSFMNFNKGTWLVEQGETDSSWSQIGKLAPSKLLHSNLKYLFANSWLTLNLNNFPSPVDPHYGRAEPNPGQLQDWTN
jgi:hypothetical protein